MLRSLLAFLLSVAITPAQDPTPDLRPHILVETIGPAGWRARLGPTNVGSLLASEQGERYWRPLVQPLMATWQALAGGDEAFASASKRVLGFDGTVRLGLFARDGDEPDLALVLDGDVGAIAEDMRTLLTGMLGPASERQIADRTLAIHENGDRFVTAPITGDRRVVIVYGATERAGTALALADQLAAQPVTLGRPGPGSAAVRVTIDLERLIAMERDGDQTATLEALGVSDLKQLTLALRAAGPRLELDADIELANAPRGVVAAFLSSGNGISTLSRLLPDETSVWKVGRFDLRALYDGILAAVEAEMEDTDARQEIEQEFGLDPSADLLAHCTDEMLVVGSPLRDYDRLEQTTWMVVWRLRDEQKFRASLAKIVPNVQPFLMGAETVDVDGVKLRRYTNLLQTDLWMAAGNGVWVLAAGRDAEEYATTLLRRAARNPAEQEFEPLRELRRSLPPGVNGIAQLDLGAFFEAPAELWFDLLDELLPRPFRFDMHADDADELGEQLHALLQQHHLDQLHTATGYSGRTWHYRIYW